MRQHTNFVIKPMLRYALLSGAIFSPGLFLILLIVSFFGPSVNPSQYRDVFVISLLPFIMFILEYLFRLRSRIEVFDQEVRTFGFRSSRTVEKKKCTALLGLFSVVLELDGKPLYYVPYAGRRKCEIAFEGWKITKRFTL